MPEHTFTLSLIGADEQALKGPGTCELLYPDCGTLSVLPDNFESRDNVDNQHLVEFTVTVVPGRR